MWDMQLQQSIHSLFLFQLETKMNATIVNVGIYHHAPSSRFLPSRHETYYAIGMVRVKQALDEAEQYFRSGKQQLTVESWISVFESSLGSDPWCCQQFKFDDVEIMYEWVEDPFDVNAHASPSTEEYLVEAFFKEEDESVTKVSISASLCDEITPWDQAFVKHIANMNRDLYQ